MKNTNQKKKRKTGQGLPCVGRLEKLNLKNPDLKLWVDTLMRACLNEDGKTILPFL